MIDETIDSQLKSELERIPTGPNEHQTELRTTFIRFRAIDLATHDESYSASHALHRAVIAVRNKFPGTVLIFDNVFFGLWC